MTFHELAEKILKESEKPLTANEIWQKAVDRGISNKLNTKGKTPWTTLGARLYVSIRDNPDSKFDSVGKRPKRFYLKNKKYNIDFEEYESGKPEEETAEKIKKAGYIIYREGFAFLLSLFCFLP